jgi:hypothetical protein
MFEFGIEYGTSLPPVTQTCRVDEGGSVSKGGDTDVRQPDVVRVRVHKRLRRIYSTCHGCPKAGHRHIRREVGGSPFWAEVHRPLTMHFPWAAFDTRTQG